MKAIIMAGGEGSRLRPLTCDRPKPLVPVANKPVMEYAIELLKKHGVTDIGVTLQYLPEAIMDYFGDGSSRGVKLRYFVEEIPLGTAGSVKNAETFLDDTFLVISGDALTDFDLCRALDFHRQRKAVASLVLTTVENPLEYGVVITEEDGRIRRFLEKPGWGEVFSDQVNTGIYVLEPAVLELIPSNQTFDFSKDLFPKLLEMKEALFACVLEGYWCDIGNLKQYQEAHEAILEGKVEVNLAETDQGNGIWLGAGVEIHPTARLEGPALIGDFSRIGPHVEIKAYTVLGNNVQVKDYASIKKSILWNGCYIGEKAQLRGTVLCQQVRVETGAAVYEGSAIGDRSKIGRRSTIKPEVKIWPQKEVGQGVIQHNSLVWGSKNRKNLFGNWGIPGPVNYEITPEIAAKIGAAFGSALPLGEKVAVSHDGRNPVQMLKNAFVSGLLSSGIHVRDLGTLPVPAHRYAVQVLQMEAGVHLKSDDEDLSKIWIQFVDKKGHVLNPNWERKIENLYAREDFRRAGIEEIGRLFPVPHFAEIYRDHILKQVHSGLIRQKKYRLVLSDHSPIMWGILPALWEELGIKIVPFAQWEEGKLLTKTQVFKILSDLAQEVVNQQAALGAILDPHGEKLYLVDDRGQIIDEDLYLLLMVSIIFQANPGSRVAVPITAPQAVEILAKRYGGQVIRTKTKPSAIMEVVADEEFSSGQGRYPQAALQFDALQALLKILEFLAEHNLSLSRLLLSIPRVYVNMEMMECPWEAKGKVMRQLIEEHLSERVELLDGIKIYKDQGWALVLPDADEPYYRIYSEGFSQEMAEELTSFYAGRIKSIIAGKTE